MPKEKMNSRMRRKADAERHNSRRVLLSDLTHIQSEIYRKHRVFVRAFYDETNQSIMDEIDRLRAIFSCDNPPPKRRIGHEGSEQFARMQLMAIAAMAGIGRNWRR